MKKILLIWLMLVVMAPMVAADYYWSYEGEELADLVIVVYFNGDSLETMHDADSGITSFDTTYNTDSVGHGLFQFKARYSYINTGIYLTGWDDYDNSRGQSDGLAHHRIYSYDSCGSALVSGTDISIYTAAGQYLQSHETENGYWDFRLTQGSSYIAYAGDPPGYTYDTTHFTTDTGTSGIAYDTVYACGHSIPAESPSASFVTAFIDVGTGIVDTTGNMIAQTDGIMYVNLVGEGRLRMDTSWAIVSKEYKATASASGRFMFHLPCNTKYSPAGSYYELSYQAPRGATGGRGTKTHWFNFVLDTLPDPVNMLDTANVRRVP
jgi:hypothetical protein